MRQLILRVIFDQLKLHSGLDAISNQKILKGIYQKCSTASVFKVHYKEPGSNTTWNNFDMHVINTTTYFITFLKKTAKNNLKTFVSLHLGQLIVLKGMLIGIYNSEDLFSRKDFALAFSKNFTKSQIQQKIEDKDPMANSNIDSKGFHTAITYY